MKKQEKIEITCSSALGITLSPYEHASNIETAVDSRAFLVSLSGIAYVTQNKRKLKIYIDKTY